MKVSILVPLIFGIFTKLSVTPLVYGFNTGGTSICDGAVTLASTWIGAAKNVEVKTISCPNLNQRRNELEPRQTNSRNVCGAPCATTCFTPSGGGPDPNDCHVIAEAFRKDSPTLQIEPGTDVAASFNSCLTVFLNRVSGPLTYCRADWAALVDSIASNCQATQNAHGGVCNANDGSWFVQVYHS